MKLTRAGVQRPGLSTKRRFMNNKSTNQLIGMGILAVLGIAILYEIWPYLVGFLAVVGAAQVYRVWRNHYSRLP